MLYRSSNILCLFLLTPLFFACGAKHEQDVSGATGGGGGGISFNATFGTGDGGLFNQAGSAGNSVGGGSSSEGDGCNVMLVGIIRDFTPDTNPDFERYSGSGPSLV